MGCLGGFADYCGGLGCFVVGYLCFRGFDFRVEGFRLAYWFLYTYLPVTALCFGYLGLGLAIVV